MSNETTFQKALERRNIAKLWRIHYRNDVFDVMARDYEAAFNLLKERLNK